MPSYFPLYEYVCLLTDGSCDTNGDCEAGSYCDSNRCILSCENSLDCSNSVCTNFTLGSESVKLCKDECSNNTSESCPGNEICVGKNQIF